MTIYKKLCAASFTMLSIFANANEIGLSKNIITFENNENKKITLDILNLNQVNTSYIETVTREVMEPQKNTKGEMRALSSPNEAGLFVTPNKQIIRSGQHSGFLSVINVNQNLDKERVYRIDVKPVISGIDKEGVKC